MFEFIRENIVSRRLNPDCFEIGFTLLGAGFIL